MAAIMKDRAAAGLRGGREPPGTRRAAHSATRARRPAYRIAASDGEVIERRGAPATLRAPWQLPSPVGWSPLVVELTGARFRDPGVLS